MSSSVKSSSSSTSSSSSSSRAPPQSLTGAARAAGAAAVGPGLRSLMGCRAPGCQLGFEASTYNRTGTAINEVTDGHTD